MGLRQPQQRKLPQFEAMRRRAQQQSNVAQQEAEDALKRKFASTGMGSSGAAIKTQANLRKDFAEQAAQAREGVDIAEQAELQRRQEVQDQRDFAAQEAQKQREFAAGESKLGREFAAGESALSRQMAADQFGKSFGLQRDTFAEQQRQARFGEGMAKDQFDIDKINSAINIATVLKESGDPAAFKNLLDQIASGEYGFNIDGGPVISNATTSGAQKVANLQNTDTFKELSKWENSPARRTIGAGQAVEGRIRKLRKELRANGFSEQEINRALGRV